LRVLDIPDAIGLLAPRRVTLVDVPALVRDRIRQIYGAAGAADKVH
jgi:hypothetical protein